MITEYEVNNDEGITHYFRNLLVHSLNNYIKDSKIESFITGSKQFYVAIGQLQGSESVTIINNLENDVSNE